MQHLSPDARKKLVKAWIDDAGYTPDKPNWFKRLISNVRIWFHNHGLPVKNLSDDDIANIIYRSAKAARDQRRTASRDGDGARFLAEDELLAKANQLKTNVVSEVKAHAIKAGDGKTAIQSAMDYVEQLPEKIFDTEIGEIEFDASSVKQSLSHTIYQNKLDAIQSVPDVLTKGVYLGSEADKDGKPIVNYYFAGKVNIGDVEKIVFVRTRKSEGRANRFYVHEVFTEDEIAKLGSQQTDAALANTSRKYRNASEFYRNIIAKVLNYKLPGEKNPEKTETDKSDGNALFSLESSGSEELKLQKNLSQLSPKTELKTPSGSVSPLLSETFYAISVLIWNIPTANCAVCSPGDCGICRKQLLRKI